MIRENRIKHTVLCQNWKISISAYHTTHTHTVLEQKTRESDREMRWEQIYIYDIQIKIHLNLSICTFSIARACVISGVVLLLCLCDVGNRTESVASENIYYCRKSISSPESDRCFVGMIYVCGCVLVLLFFSPHRSADKSHISCNSNKKLTAQWNRSGS